VKSELIWLAVILVLLLSIVASCQNRDKPFQDRMNRWREYREQQKQKRDTDDRRGIVPDDQDDERRRERRRIFPREDLET
jgi:hypothetical protein